MNTNITHF